MKNTKNVFLLIISLMAFIVFCSEIVITIVYQKNTSIEQMNTYLVNLAEKEALVLDSKITNVGQNSKILAEIISNDDTLDYDFYNKYIAEKLQNEPMAFGMGYWFEPFYTDPQVEYFGPYTYKDDEGKAVTTMMYSDEVYDYFAWDWYHDGITAPTSYHFTEPYDDELLDTVFMTVSNKIIRGEEVVGLATIGITLREITAYIDSIQIGENGEAFILTREGMVLGENANDTSNITFENPSIKEEIIHSEVSGSIVRDGIITVWAPIGLTNMRVVFCYPENELMTGIYGRILLTSIMFIISMVLFSITLNFTLKQIIEKPLRQILNYNKMTIYDNDDLNQDQFKNVQPNFDNMVILINRLLEERNSSIVKLNEKNDELEIKNEEIEALYQQTSAMNITLHQLLEDIRDGYIVTVRSLSNAIEAKDKYTKGHCERVTKYATDTAKKFDLTGDEFTSLEYASILHDIGKIGMPTSILNKPGKLTEEEYEYIMQHPRIGYDILKDIEFLENSVDIVLHHHERIDGKGYPDGLKSEEIGLSTKILTVADAYDAMTSSRPYRKDPLTKEEAIDILKSCSGTQFDEGVVRVFVDMMNN